MLSPRQQANLTQRIDDAAGRYFDRLWVFDLNGFVTSTTSLATELSAMSQGARHIKVTALRVTCAGSTDNEPPTPLEFAALRLRLQLNGSDWVTDQAGGNDVSFASLCVARSPWYWFELPLRVRAGDILRATVSAPGLGGEAHGLTPALAMRVMDSKLYDRLYDRMIDRVTSRCGGG